MRGAAILGAATALSGCAEGTDYGALWIEHGPGWWPLLGLAVLVAWLSRRRGFLDGLTELSAFGVQLKRDVRRVDVENDSLASEVAALRAETARLEAGLSALREGRADDGEGRDDGRADSAQRLVAGSRAPRVVIDQGGAGMPTPPPPAPTADDPTGRGDDDIAEQVDALLGDPRFEWRSLGRLAAETGLTEPWLRTWLAARPNRYRLGESASGRPLARLRRR